MNDSVQVNQVYLIFNRPQFLVDSSVIIQVKILYSKYLNNNGRLNSISVQIFTVLAVIREHKLPTSEGLPSYFMFPL